MMFFLPFFTIFCLFTTNQGTFYEVVQDSQIENLNQKYLIEKNETKSCYDLIIQELINQAIPVGKIIEINNEQNQNHLPDKDLLDNEITPRYYGEYYKLLKHYDNPEFAETSLKSIYEKIKCQRDKPQTLFTENPEVNKGEDDDEDNDDDGEEEDNQIKQRRFQKKTKQEEIPYRAEINLYNSEVELTCRPNFQNRHDKFDYGIKVDKIVVQENIIPFSIRYLYTKLFQNNMLKYQCINDQNEKVPKPKPGFSKYSLPNDLQVQIISRTKRMIKLSIYHELIEMCVADYRSQMNSYWVLDRSYKARYYNKSFLRGNNLDTYQRIIYVGGYNGTQCDLKTFVSRRDHPDKPCIPIHTTMLQKKILLTDVIKRAFDYGLAYPKYGRINTHCQHFAKNLYQEITNVDMMYTNGQFMKRSNFGWYKKMRKRNFPNWFFDSMKKSKQDNIRKFLLKRSKSPQIR